MRKVPVKGVVEHVHNIDVEKIVPENSEVSHVLSKDNLKEIEGFFHIIYYF